MSPSIQPVIVWFRRDLRLEDNPALSAACATGQPVICLYVLENVKDLRSLGGASKWWLNKSLASLSDKIKALGGELALRSGDPRRILSELANTTGASAAFWNRRYDEAGREIDTQIKSDLKTAGLTVESFNGSLLMEPWTMKTGSGGYYKVFTPFWKAVQSAYSPAPAHPAPDRLPPVTGLESDSLAEWGLHPSSPDWSGGFDEIWSPGEAGAHERLESFLESAVGTYGEDRNRPDLPLGTSGLSPHLAFGEICPAQIWRRTMMKVETGQIDAENSRKFLSEVCWRDFGYVLLYHNPELATQNYKPDFDHLPWRTDPDALKAWQTGQTGYPIVDAGMRQLWQTGYMHNRVRMITASFLTKHLLMHWTAGEDWFWDTLVDADPASNSASWQWVAGCGADAAPYFRVFNPITQGEKFDVTGDYVRRWCPELAKLPNKYLFKPWEADAATLHRAGVTFGETYPAPIVEHKAGRERALAAYETLKERRAAA